jgi:hypothetical protein
VRTSSPAKIFLALSCGGEDDRALLLPGGDGGKEEVRLLTVEGTEAHLVDENERAVGIALRLLSRAGGIAA